MHEFLITEEFIKQYQKLPKAIQKKAERQQKLFLKNPLYPSLHTEKLQPKDKEIWSFRIDREYRIIFRFLSSDEVILLTCGHHSWIYRYSF